MRRIRTRSANRCMTRSRTFCSSGDNLQYSFSGWGRNWTGTTSGAFSSSTREEIINDYLSDELLNSIYLVVANPSWYELTMKYVIKVRRAV